MSDTGYLYKYWVKVPYIEHKKFFMTKQSLKDFIYTCAINEFSFSVVQYYGFEEVIYQLKALGYNFSHKVR